MDTTARHPRWIASAAIASWLVCSAGAAQHAEKQPMAQVSVEERAKAAEAYDEGTSAYLAEHYELAAHWFERAYRLVPTSAALLQAVRAYHKAGEFLRAANLALELRASYPSDGRATRAADAVIGSVRDTSLLVDVRCNETCALELDGTVVRHPKFFTTPEVEHTIKAGFATGETSTSVLGAPGDTERLALEAPLPPPPPPIPRWTFFSSLGATVALGAATIWSGIDANQSVGTYESAARTASSPGINDGSSPTPAEQAQTLLDDGQRKERRTNILIGVTAGMAAATAVIGVFTNWKGESRQPSSKRVEGSVGVGHKGGAFMIKGRF